MTADQAAHARARAQGPLRLGPGAPAPAGMTRLSGPDSSGVALPVWPDGVTPSLLEEHQVPPMPVERAGETRRVLAAVLKCCWADQSADPWPGEPAPLERVLDTYRALIGRTDDLMRNWAIGALRRLHDSAWVVVAGGIVSLGPRCALWPVESHAVLKDLVRRIPEPERRAVPVVPDAGLVAAALPEPAAPDQGAGSRAEPGVAEFDDLLSGYDERRRAELVSAFMVVEHAAEPVQEARFAALRDPALRRTLAEMLARRGRTLVQQRERWISGYADELVRDEPPGGGPGESERAVLTLVLVHSVAIPRAEGLLPEDSWLSPHPAPVDELRRHTQLPIGELESALRALRHAGLVTQVKAGEEAGGYVPGPQFHRLTPEARRRLQEELILAAGPDTPLAVAVRARRAAR
ncbi:helix-turn-helix domain-containing protein [Nonomuraea sp. NPDC049486]|uniref:helix-turn-helix domain-containing protein n=1 Tax=unclassified Nonomuraea TaxID=2593643 RepID=UPI00341D314B